MCSGKFNGMGSGPLQRLHCGAQGSENHVTIWGLYLSSCDVSKPRPFLPSAGRG